MDRKQTAQRLGMAPTDLKITNVDTSRHGSEHIPESRRACAKRHWPSGSDVPVPRHRCPRCRPELMQAPYHACVCPHDYKLHASMQGGNGGKGYGGYHLMFSPPSNCSIPCHLAGTTPVSSYPSATATSDRQLVHCLACDVNQAPN
jgi:hypothetical protein